MERKPPFGRMLLAGVVAVGSLLPWVSVEFMGTSAHQIAWGTWFHALGLSVPAWLVVPLAGFAAVIAWGRHRNWHDLPRFLPGVLDAVVVVIAGGTLLTARPGFGALLTLLAASTMLLAEVTEAWNGGEVVLTVGSPNPSVVSRLQRRRRIRETVERVRQEHAERATVDLAQPPVIVPASHFPDGTPAVLPDLPEPGLDENPR